MNILTRLRSQPRWLLITAGAVVVVLVAGVTTVALLPTSSSPNDVSATSTPRATPTATPVPEAVALPTADVAASFDGWTQGAEEDTDSSFTAEAGDPLDGSIALRIESTNPAENPTRRTLNQVVEVAPSTEYTFSASVKSTADTKTPPSVAVIMGAAGQGRFDFAKATATWAEQTWKYTTAADETTLPVSLLTVGPTTGTRIDGLVMTAKGSPDNLLVNASFETFEAANPQITNASLLLATGEATVGVSWRIPGASWTLTDDTGATVDQGTLDLQPGLGVVSLQDVEAGYYSIDIVNNENLDDHLQTSLAILAPLAENAPAADERFGAGIHLTPPYLNSGQVAADIGISSVRTDGKWNGVEKSVGVYNFPALPDAMLQDYTDAGVGYLPISNYGNSLYDSGFTPSSPTALAAYGAFTNELVSHYNSPAVEIYNEFNHPPMNKGKCGITPDCYIPLLQSASAAVKANHPDTKIIGPAIARNDDAWLTGLYQAGGLQYLDAISFHPYDYTVESGPEFLEASVQQAEARIKEYNNGETKPIWITELGWSTAGFSEQDQADNLVRAQAIAFANNVERFYWYDLVNDETDLAHHEGNFGLVRQVTSTVPAFAPKPSGVAQAVLIRKISGKAFTARDTLADTSVYSYAFGAAKSTTRVAWATTPVTVTYAAAGDVTSTDQFGAITTLKPVDGLITVELDGHPIYLDGVLEDLQKAS